MNSRWDEIQGIWQETPWLYTILGFLLGLLTLPAIRAVSVDVGAFLENMVPEAIGIVFTVVFVDRLYRHREQQRLRTERIDQLIHDMGSPVNTTAINAARGLKSMGALGGGALRGVKLLYANLAGANLFRADLADMNLSNANLAGATLMEADLSRVRLRKANLEGTKFRDATLEDARLENAICVDARFENANLRGAYFNAADLSGADLTGADLTGAKLFGVTFDEQTILPDGTHWSPTADVLRFVSLSHPQYRG